MKIVNGYDLLRYAQEKHLVLPAFNTINLEMTYGIANGLSRAGLPGFIQISSNNLRVSGPGTIVGLTREALRNTSVPIALHLDHGKSFEDVKACCDAGFTSIMVDNSALPYEDNVKECRKAVEYCHFYGVPVEVELGAIRGKEEDIVNEEDSKTDPDLVADFVGRTGCDLLAVSVGNVHGLSIEPKIDLPLLEKINNVCSVPLVLHGGSGIPADVIQKAKEFGLIKINYGAALRKVFISTFGREYEKDHNAHDIMSLSVEAVENITQEACSLVRMINGLNPG